MNNSKSHYFSENEELKSYYHNLSHWEQSDKLQFITFRLADSLPQSALDELRKIRQRMMDSNESIGLDNDINKLRKLTFQRIEYWLEQGYGECVLRNPDIRRIVEDSLRFISDRCVILAYVIMPNHVHLLVYCNEGEEWARLLGSIRQYSAKKINEKLGKRGALWQKEPYNRIIRDSGHFLGCLNYIRNNPKNMHRNNYTLYQNDDAISYVLHHQD